MIMIMRKLFSQSPPPSSIASLLCVVWFVVVSMVEAKIRLPENMTIPAVIVFGDSIVDQGNNNELPNSVAKSNFPPYGKDFMGGIPTGRFSNGKTPADFIAEDLGIKELVPAYKDPNLQPNDLPTGVSFASGACGFDPQTAQTASVYSLSDQLEMYKEYIEKLKEIVEEERTNNIITNSIFLVVAGSDDLANTYFLAGIRRLQYDIDSYTNFLVQSAIDFVMKLYNLGARRIPVTGIAPIGCLPSQRTLGGAQNGRKCVEKYNKAGQLFNTKLSIALRSLQSKLNDPKVLLIYVDIYNPLLDLIQNHEKYGFAVADRGCCGTGLLEVSVLCNKLSETCPDDSKFIFWDSYHPTERVYRILSTQIVTKIINNFL